MPQFHKKGPSKKSEYYVKDRSLEKPPDPRNESLRYKALENKVFYFDFKNSSTAAWLEKEIRKLGGRVEYFFGKEVQYLITDKPQYLVTDKPQAREIVPPCSPFSNPGPSPFSRPDTSQSMRDPGPTPSEWAYSDLWKKPQASSQRSRASKLMELASITKSQGSCDVLSRAKERGTTIKTVEQITSWLHTVHKKLGTKLSRDNLKEPPKNPSRKLRGNYMKVEDTEHKYKPQVLDDASPWQTIDCTALSDETAFSTEKRITRNIVKKSNQAKPTSIKGILKKESTTSKKKSGKGHIRKRGAGKCEGCNVRFEKLETHLAAEQHIKYAKKDKNFDAIDQLESEGLSLENFMMEQHNKVALDSKSAALKHVLSPQVKSDCSTEPLDVDGPCTRARKQKFQQDLTTLTPLAPKETDQIEIAGGPSPKVAGLGVPELDNNYYLRSTPRKLVGMLDHWDTQWDTVPEQISQVSVVSDGTFLQCRSLDLYSSQGQITTGAVDRSPTDYAVKRPRIINSPITTRILDSVSPGCVTRQRSPLKVNTRSQTPPPNTRSRSPKSPRTLSRNNYTVQAPSPSTVQAPSPSTVQAPSPSAAPLLNSPNKRSPRSSALPRRVTNHC